jgi:hypothetical protein
VVVVCTVKLPWVTIRVAAGVPAIQALPTALPRNGTLNPTRSAPFAPALSATVMPDQAAGAESSRIHDTSVRMGASLAGPVRSAPDDRHPQSPQLSRCLKPRRVLVSFGRLPDTPIDESDGVACLLCAGETNTG